MAIIYTYPRLTNPDGTELIVVSETKNQNATRLLSVGDICEFCSDPSGGGCSNSFLTVTTPASIIPATALGCDDNLVLTSGDGSITISNVGNTINFTTAGGGGGGCPTNYVLKPVTCEEGECFISTKLEEWVWTCDETLGALAPGYIDGLTLNGTALPHPSSDLGDTCWYIEAVTLSGAASTCEECCTPGETAYKLSPCDGDPGGIYYTTETLTPGIAALVGMVILATTPAGTLCYTVTEESGDPPIAVTPLAVQEEGCEAEICTPPPGENLLLTPCEGNSEGYNSAIITDTTQSPSLIGVAIGDMVSIVTSDPATLQACYTISTTAIPIGAEVVVVAMIFNVPHTCECCLVEGREYEECFTGATYTFSTNDWPVLANNPACIKIVPFGMEEPPLCLNFVQCTEVEYPTPVLSLIDNSPNCCEDVDCPSTARYEKCPDAPEGYEEFIYLSIPTGAAPVILATGDLDPGVVGDETWCYTYKDNTEGPVFVGTVADYCPPLAHCMCPESCEIMEYFNCDDPGTLLYTTNMSLPPVGFIWGIAEDGNCYKTSGPVLPNGLPLNVITVDAVWMDSSEECGCCAGDTYPFTYTYNLCTEYDPAPVGAPASVIVDITGYPGYLSGAYPNVISVDVGVGYDVCYEFGIGICTLATHTLVSTYEDCATCIAGEDPIWDLLPCGGTPGVDNVYLSQGDLAPDPSGLNVGDIIDITGGTLSDGCYEVIDKNSATPASHTGMHNWTGPFAASGDEYYTACECCEVDLRLYDICDLGAPCTLISATQLIIDMTAFGGTPPTHIIATDIASGNDCCYYLSEIVPECQEFTGTYTSVIPDCEDPLNPGQPDPTCDALPGP